MSSASSATRELWRDVLAIAAVHALVCAVARAAGFDHVSDDDFARITIAQTFAHSPKLDPSGTSWLPFPFWLLGGLLAVAGRTLAAARALSVAVASLAAAAPYVALRFAGTPRARALLAAAFAYATPWGIWLGAATVPESLTASLTAAGAIGLAARGGRRSFAAAGAIALACLSRYEAWPVAAVLAIALGVRALAPPGPERRHALGLALVCAAAPLAWMAWNAHVHDGPLHFFRRVSSFKRAIGDGTTDALGATLLFPRLLVTVRPEVTVAALLLVLPALRDAELRRRWLLPLIAAAAQIAFLAYGNVRDGAPAHHPERALFATFVLLALFAVDAGSLALQALARPWARRTALACVAAVWLGSIVRDLAEPPGQGAAEDRSAQVARGRALGLRDANASAPRLTITPCAFEHFALLAAYAAPERAEVKPRTNEPVSAACPHVEE